MADLDSVREFAARLHADGDGIDVLINNAGIMIPPRSLSPQGHELQFATNHLGHFALTGLLLDLLEAGINPRVVTVTSESHRRGSIHFDDLTGERNYSPVQFYSQSKLANVLFGLELHRRLSAAGSPVRSLIAHPGFASTNLQTNGPTGVLRVGADDREMDDLAGRRDGRPSAVVCRGRGECVERAVHRPWRLSGDARSPNGGAFAGMMALIDQAAGAPHGFANPLFYSHAGDSTFRDVTSPAATVAVVRANYKNGVDASLGLGYVLRTMNQTLSLRTTSGYDDVTGLGTPQALLGLNK